MMSQNLFAHMQPTKRANPRPCRRGIFIYKMWAFFSLSSSSRIEWMRSREKSCSTLHDPRTHQWHGSWRTTRRRRLRGQILTNFPFVRVRTEWVKWTKMGFLCPILLVFWGTIFEHGESRWDCLKFPENSVSDNLLPMVNELQVCEREQSKQERKKERQRGTVSPISEMSH